MNSHTTLRLTALASALLFSCIPIPAAAGPIEIKWTIDTPLEEISGFRIEVADNLEMTSPTLIPLPGLQPDSGGIYRHTIDVMPPVYVVVLAINSVSATPSEVHRFGIPEPPQILAGGAALTTLVTIRWVKRRVPQR